MHTARQAQADEQVFLAVRSNSSGISTEILKHPASSPVGEQTIFRPNAGGHAASVIFLPGYLFLLL